MVGAVFDNMRAAEVAGLVGQGYASRRARSSADTTTTPRLRPRASSTALTIDSIRGLLPRAQGYQNRAPAHAPASLAAPAMLKVNRWCPFHGFGNRR